MSELERHLADRFQHFFKHLDLFLNAEIALCNWLSLLVSWAQAISHLSHLSQFPKRPVS